MLNAAAPRASIWASTAAVIASLVAVPRTPGPLRSPVAIAAAPLGVKPKVYGPVLLRLGVHFVE